MQPRLSFRWPLHPALDHTSAASSACTDLLALAIVARCLQQARRGSAQRPPKVGHWLLARAGFRGEGCNPYSGSRSRVL